MTTRTRTRDVQEERKSQRDFQREQRTLQQAFNQDGELSQSFIEGLLDTDDIQRGTSEDLQDVTITKMQNVLTRDVVLGNFTSAQEHDKRYWIEVQKYKVLGTHPPEESRITGATRAFLFDDELEELQPLSQQERLLIHDFFEVLKDRVTRGRDGFERKQMNTSIARSEHEDNDTQQEGMLTGLF